MRLTILRSLALGALVLAGQARAGDIATLAPIGFSADGSVFAFEEYGIEDGSGFPYANVYFLDLAKDRFMAPSPVRIRLDADSRTAEPARKKAREKASALFDRYAPEANPGRAVVANPASEVSTDPHRAEFLPRDIRPSPDEPVGLRLEEFAMAAGEACADIGVETRGYRLLEIALDDSGKTRTLHEDRSIPANRKCPLAYRLTEVRVFDKPAGGFAGVAIIGVESLGFEGPDLRFIANPVPLH